MKLKQPQKQPWVPKKHWTPPPVSAVCVCGTPIAKLVIGRSTFWFDPTKPDLSVADAGLCPGAARFHAPDDFKTSVWLAAGRA